ncbi:MAG: T9SS type A sorting domain-containing protein [Cyclobacteriaceae bacterium]|uniref:T9SS type A sorting domain-containing protein n=1 Tax=Nonlabens ulvanivorans TaxID=906888 RepID=UPI00328EDC90
MKDFYLFLFFLLISLYGHATHIHGGEIQIKKVNGSTLTYEITVKGFRNTGSDIYFGGGTLAIGTEKITGPFNFDEPIRLSDELEIVSFSYRYSFPAPSGAGYFISYTEEYRNADILNIENSVGTSFYLEAFIVIDPFLGTSSSPVLSEPSVHEAQVGKAYVANLGAYDPDGDSVAYEIIIPKKSFSAKVDNYRFPNDLEFYSQEANGSEEGECPTLSIDSQGILRWDAPGDVNTLPNDAVGRQYTIAVKVEDWRKLNGTWYRIGYIVRDFQVWVTGENQPGSKRDFICATEPLNNISNQTFRLYPNPTTDRVYIDSRYGFTYQIIDQSGKVLTMGQVQEETEYISLRKLNQGVYILRVNQMGEYSTHQLVKTN